MISFVLPTDGYGIFHFPESFEIRYQLGQQLHEIVTSEPAREEDLYATVPIHRSRSYPVMTALIGIINNCKLAGQNPSVEFLTETKKTLEVLKDRLLEYRQSRDVCVKAALPLTDRLIRRETVTSLLKKIEEIAQIYLQSKDVPRSENAQDPTASICVTYNRKAGGYILEEAGGHPIKVSAAIEQIGKELDGMKDGSVTYLDQVTYQWDEASCLERLERIRIALQQHREERGRVSGLRHAIGVAGVGQETIQSLLEQIHRIQEKVESAPV